MVMATNAGIERITYGELRAEARLAREAQRDHLKLCRECSKVGVSVYQRCDEGWDLAKRTHRADYRLGQFTAAVPDGQAALW